jgi:3-oxoacyl-[acyl-carrier protein] reductase
VDLGLAGKVAVVYGASRGLGRAAAEALAAEGARVAIVARNEATLREAASSIAKATRAEVVPFTCDVSKADDVRRSIGTIAREFGGLDILVNNSGGPPAGSFATLSESDFAAAVELLFMSVVRTCREAVPLMRARGGGRIINITSVTVKQPVDNLMLSNAVRPAVVGLSRSLATELAPDRITVNCVAPGYTRTERVVELNEANAAKEQSTLAAIEQRLVASIPMKRLGEPYELAALIAFLASDKAAYITGTTLQVDGGYVRSLY